MTKPANLRHPCCSSAPSEFLGGAFVFGAENNGGGALGTNFTTDPTTRLASRRYSNGTFETSMSELNETESETRFGAL